MAALGSLDKLSSTAGLVSLALLAVLPVLAGGSYLVGVLTVAASLVPTAFTACGGNLALRAVIWLKADCVAAILAPLSACKRSGSCRASRPILLCT